MKANDSSLNILLIFHVLVLTTYNILSVECRLDIVLRRVHAHAVQRDWNMYVPTTYVETETKHIESFDSPRQENKRRAGASKESLYPTVALQINCSAVFSWLFRARMYTTAITHCCGCGAVLCGAVLCSMLPAAAAALTSDSMSLQTLRDSQRGKRERRKKARELAA